MTMRVMLDTNALAAFIKARSPALETFLLSRTVCISVITEAEIRYGLARRPEASRLHAAVESLLATVEIPEWTPTCAAVYASVRADLEASGNALAALDTLIACHALALDVPLVTADVAFDRVPGLDVIRWSAKAVRMRSRSPPNRLREKRGHYRTPGPRTPARARPDC